MSIITALPALVFGLGAVFALVVLIASLRRALAAWGELARALEVCGESGFATVTIFETGTGVPARPHLRLVENPLRPRAAECSTGLRAAA